MVCFFSIFCALKRAPWLCKVTVSQAHLEAEKSGTAQYRRHSCQDFQLYFGSGRGIICSQKLWTKIFYPQNIKVRHTDDSFCCICFPSPIKCTVHGMLCKTETLLRQVLVLVLCLEEASWAWWASDFSPPSYSPDFKKKDPKQKLLQYFCSDYKRKCLPILCN